MTCFQVDQVAAGFISLGLKRTDRVGIWGPNSYEWIVTQLAAARAGLILVHLFAQFKKVLRHILYYLFHFYLQVNINPAYKSPELRYAINKVEIKALVVADNFRNQNLPAILNELIPEKEKTSSSGDVISSPLLPSLQKVITLSQQPQQKSYFYYQIIEEI